MTISEKRRKRLERSGWQFGTVAEFLNLTPEESALIEMQFMLADELKAARIKLKLSQVALAKKLGSSQSRIAKMESGHPSVSLDLLVRALLALGHNPKSIGRTLQKKRAA